MSSLDFDLDTQMSRLELEWHRAYESSVVARTDYQTLLLSHKASASLIDMARVRLDRAEALRAQIMGKIDRLEDSMLGQE
jgi:hypothetical protein